MLSINKHINMLFVGLVSILFAAPSHCQVLEGLILESLASHPAMSSAQAQGRAAKASLESAAWEFFPTPSVGLERSYVSPSDRAYSGDANVLTLRLQQPLWTGGRLTATKDRAEAGVAMNLAALEEVRLQIALRVVQGYTEWLTAHSKLLALDTSLATHVRLNEQVKRRIAQGLQPESDQTLAQSRLQAVVAEMATLQAQSISALARLAQLTGREVSSEVLARQIAKPYTPEPATPLPSALAVSASIQKSRAQARMQSYLVAERRAELSPEVFLRAERQYGSTAYANTAPENRLFIGLSSRFGAGLSSLSAVDAAQAQYQAALAEVEVQIRSVTEQVNSDKAMAHEYRRRLSALQAARLASAEVAQAHDRQFLSGRKTWLDVMNAARELAQAETQIVEAQATMLALSWRLALYAKGAAEAMLSSK